jgi:hypothetical protein
MLQRVKEPYNNPIRGAFYFSPKKVYCSSSRILCFPMHIYYVNFSDGELARKEEQFRQNKRTQHATVTPLEKGYVWILYCAELGDTIVVVIIFG